MTCHDAVPVSKPHPSALRGGKAECRCSVDIVWGSIDLENGEVVTGGGGVTDVSCSSYSLKEWRLKAMQISASCDFQVLILPAALVLQGRFF